MTNNSLSDSSLVLCIDIGTTSLKAAFVRGDGEVFSFKRVSYAELSQAQNAVATKIGSKTKNGAAATEIASKPKNGAAAWADALKKILPDSLCANCAAVSVSGNGPTIVSASGATLMWRDDAKNCSQAQDCAATEIAGKAKTAAANQEAPQAQDAAGAKNCLQDLKGAPADLFEKLDIPDAQKKIYQPRLAAFARLFPDDWEQSPRLYTSTQWLCDYIEKNAGALGLANGVPVFDAGPDFIAALVGTATIEAGRLCDRAGSSEGLNLCSPKFFEEQGLRTMPSPARGLWNISYLIEDPGSSRQEKVDNFFKAYKTLTQAAAANGVEVAGQLMVTGGQAQDQDLLQKKADSVGARVAVAQIADAELLGCAAAAFFRLGKYSSLEQAAKGLVRVGKVFEPQDEFPRFYSVPQDLRAIIFDIDSTLYTNAAYAFEQVDCQVRRFASLCGITNEEARKMVADYRKQYARQTGGKKISLSNTLLQFGISIEQSVQWRRELIEPADFLGKDHELRAALLALKGRFKLLCVTNNPILPAQKTLQALGVDDLMEVLVGLDSCNLSKPAKEPFELAAQKAGVNPCQMISVGDRYDLDIAPALELGMGGVLVRGVSDVYKLPGLL
ncbi:MAG: HAD hydrolase-like protein [Treponema sp.]|nr:HAD hydrolase-like protein [Treponema sp.]